MAQERKCKICESVLEYKSIHLFGDPDLGERDAWLECPECGQRYNLWTGKERE